MKSPLQGLFDFSKKEQIGLLILVAIILACLIVLNFHDLLFPRETVDASEKERALIAAIAAIEEADEKEYAVRYEKSPKKDRLPEPFEFDPNTLSAEGYVSLGFSDKQASSIRNYLDKGGRIWKTEDFKKLFVVNDFMYNRLKGHIKISELPPDESKARIDNQRDNTNWQPEESIEREPDEPILVELNATDADRLIALKGIGPIYAKRILSYRELLGGYTSVEQLKEVYGLNEKPEIVESLKSSLTVNLLNVKRIDINSAEWKNLVRHPYIDEKVANSIINMRETHGPYGSVEDLSRSHLISDELLQKISPYLMVIE